MAESGVRRGIALRDRNMHCQLVIYARVAINYGPRASNGHSERACQIVYLYLQEGNTNQGNFNVN
jgi:hypothetical protein